MTLKEIRPVEIVGERLAILKGENAASFSGIHFAMRLLSTSTSSCLTLLVYASLVTSSLLRPRGLVSGGAIEVKATLTDDKTTKPTTSLPAKPADGIGTKDAPVDGKDGKPHSGPFVETSAERDRKKAKEAGDDVDVKKPAPKVIPSGAPKDNLPESNDGVMDDPNRKGPKDGTRGTEGGITEKNKDGVTADSKSEKKPDPPKEQPPLPHSEQQSLTNKANSKEDTKKEKEKGTDTSVLGDEKKKGDTIKEIGGLEVAVLAMQRIL